MNENKVERTEDDDIETDGLPVQHYQVEILSIRKYKAGYEVRTEKHTDNTDKDNSITIRSAYNQNGDYIGNPKTAHRLVVIRGIVPETIDTNGRTCSIGFCEKEHKWYGWSHRALYGFGINDVVKKGDCTATSGYIDEYLIDHPEDDLSLPIGFKAETMEDAKRMAIAFADSVS